jgi:hypothetical protein
VAGFSKEAALIDEVQHRLARRFARLPPDQITDAVRQAYASFTDCRVRHFIPLLVERRACRDLSRRAAVDRLC